MSDRTVAQVAAALTARQRAALLQHDLEGVLTEGLIADCCWPLIADRGVRRVALALESKGLVTVGAWWGEGVGCELLLTDLGRAVLDHIGAAEHATQEDA